MGADDHGRRCRGVRPDQRRSEPSPLRPGIRDGNPGRRPDRPRRPDNGPVQRARRAGPAGSGIRVPPPGVGLSRIRADRGHGHRGGRGRRGPGRQADHPTPLRRAPERRRPRSSAGSASSTRCDRGDARDRRTRRRRCLRGPGPGRRPAGQRAAARDPRGRRPARVRAVVQRLGGRAPARRGLAHDRARPAVPHRRGPAGLRGGGDRSCPDGRRRRAPGSPADHRSAPS